MRTMRIHIGEDLVIRIDGSKVEVSVMCDSSDDAERVVRQALEQCSFNVTWPPYRQVGRVQ